jgi:NAD(P)H-dependent FMN reductase
MKKIILMLLVTVPLLAKMNILVFAGSTRADSYNKKLAREAVEMAGKLGAKVTLIDLKDYPMPFYDGDLEKEGMPKDAKRFRDLMVASDAIIIASPEYNGSISAVLKNALDWASRDEKGNPSRAAFEGKRFALMSASPGEGGGARGLAHLRAIIESIGGTVLEQQTVVGRAHEAFTKDKLGTLNNEVKRELQGLEKAAGT